MDLELALTTVLAVVVLLLVAAQFTRVPYPILLVLGGLGLALLPPIPDVELNPDLVLIVILPPLLYAAAYFTPLRELRRNVREISALAVGYIFKALLEQDGALNGVLSSLVGHQVDTPWLGSTTWTLVVVTLIHGWKWMGLAMLIYLAGLKSMPDDVLEAARIDGAGAWRTFWSIRFPLLAPAVTFNVTTALIGSMNTFDIVQATTAGGPGSETEVFNIYMFRIFGQGLYAQASAMSLVLFLIVVVLAVPVIVGLRRRENNQ